MAKISDIQRSNVFPIRQPKKINWVNLVLMVNVILTIGLYVMILTK